MEPAHPWCRQETRKKLVRLFGMPVASHKNRRPTTCFDKPYSGIRAEIGSFFHPARGNLPFSGPAGHTKSHNISESLSLRPDQNHTPPGRRQSAPAPPGWKSPGPKPTAPTPLDAGFPRTRERCTAAWHKGILRPRGLAPPSSQCRANGPSENGQWLPSPL